MREIDPATEPFHHAVTHLVGHARARWPLVEYARVSTQISRMFESAILAELEPADAVARASAVISGITGLPERGRRRPATRPTLSAASSGW
jgi:hypothetical protein